VIVGAVHRDLISIPNFCICGPISVEFGTRNLHLMLLSICELCANRCRKDRIAVIGVSENEFTHMAVKLLLHFENKECLDQVFVLRHKVHRLKSRLPHQLKLSKLLWL
jgi:hypothetical protein